MGAKQRSAKERRPAFSPQILRLFAELESTPEHRRDTDEFKQGDKKLMYALDLGAEFWTMNSVLKRSGPCHPEGLGYIANEHWETCCEIRLQLLEALAADPQPRLN